jgi:hypothetical protein
MHHQKPAPVPSAFMIPAAQPVQKDTTVRRVNANDEATVLLLKPAASLILRTQDSRSMIHTHIGTMTRAKRALELSGCPNSACPEQVPLIRIAVATIGVDLSSAKMALLCSEECLREAHKCANALQLGSALANAAGLVIHDFEKERIDLGVLMGEVRELYQTYRNALN